MRLLYSLTTRISALFLLMLTSPFSVIAMLLVFLIYHENPLFKQDRIGYRGVRFKLFKIRTFHNGKPSSIGRILRKTSIDELPQLWNVANGTMALVGPRPLMHTDITLYGDEPFTLYCTVLPGLTGLFQVNGRKNLTMHQRSLYDYHYISNKSLYLDLKIILATIPALLSCKGAR